MGKGQRNRKIRELDPDVPYEQYPPWLKNRIRDAARDLASDAIDRHLNDCDAIILYVLHTEFGFGKDRLRRYYDKYLELYKDMLAQYESFKDADYWCQDELRKIGVDVASWNDETYQTAL